MNEPSERDKIIMDLKSELLDIQQNSKNNHNLQETDNEYQNEYQNENENEKENEIENEILQNEKQELEFFLRKIQNDTSKEINDLKLDINNLNEELNIKKEKNIQLFIQNENLEKKLEIITKQNIRFFTI